MLSPGLGDEESVERISVMQREPTLRPRVVGRDGKQIESFLEHCRRQRILNLQTADRRLE